MRNVSKGEAANRGGPTIIVEELQEAPEVPWVQEDLGGLLARLDLLVRLDQQDQLVRRRRGRLFRPLVPRALEVLRARETNRNHPMQASSPKLRAPLFFA
jgi:hypothetical protein